MSLPLVSIITPNFNRAYIIRETAQSILNQTYHNWEWIICDDNSVDNSFAILEQIAEKDNRIKVIERNRNPNGAPTCRNIAIEKSSGKYLIFLDNDDLLAENCLKNRVAEIEADDQADFIIFPMLLFKNQKDDLKILWNIERDEDEVNRILFGDAICQGSGTIWKKESFIKIGMWKEGLLIWQDVELHLRSLLFGAKFTKKMNQIPDLFIRVSENSISRTNYHSIEKTRSRIEVLKAVIDYSFITKKFDKYKFGLRHMSLEIFNSLFSCRNILEFRNLVKHLFKFNLFGYKEITILIFILIINKFRLIRFQVIKNLQKRLIVSMDIEYEPTLCKMHYNGTLKGD